MTSQLSPVGRFERILLAIDGSEFSAGAVREAITLAGKCEARLYVMGVVLTNPEYETFAPQLVEKAEKETMEHLLAIKASATQAKVECETILRHGQDVYREIVEEAEENSMDIIVIGRRGKTGLMRVMMGSVTAKVIGHSHCAVLVVPRVAQVASHNILLATDGSRYSDAAAASAGSLAKQLQLPVKVLSVVHPAHTDTRRSEGEQAAKRVGDFLTQMGVTATTQIIIGRPAETIVEEANKNQSGLIVVGTHGRTGLEKLLVGSVSERVIGLAKGAVMVVRG